MIPIESVTLFLLPVITLSALKIHKTKNMLSVMIDSKLSAVANIPENMSGKIGFASSKVIEIDNIKVQRLGDQQTPSVKKINIVAERTDIEEILLKFDNEGSDVVYRVYRNGIWLYDTSNPEFTDDSIKSGIDYTYEIFAYDKNTFLVGKGTFDYRLPDDIDPNLFCITECKVRTGENGSYNENIYIPRNKGLSANQRIYCDRVYTFGEIPEKFENAAYLMTRAEDAYNPYMQSQDTTDFVTFKINKSATVYVLVHPNAHKTNPGWIADNGWVLTDFEVGSYTKVFAKHYIVSGSSTTTVSVGGFRDKLPMMYSIVVVPEEKAEFFAVTDCLVKTGEDGAFESGKYTVVNSGLTSGCKKYTDRNYTYEEILPVFENAAYIMTANNDTYNAELQSDTTDEFVKFNINKSATVYLLVDPNKSVIVPSWLNEWKLTDYSIIGFSRIYSRHYEVVPGNTATVSIGGFKGKLPTMYTVVIKPD